MTANRPTPATATQLAEHLGLTRQRIGVLADAEHVIERLPTGRFDLDSARLAYLNWLRDPARRAARSEAASEHARMKTRLLALRIAEQEGRLMEVSETEELIDQMCALFRTGLGSLPARVTRDLQIRRAIDAAAFDIMTKIANVAEERAKVLEARKA